MAIPAESEKCTLCPPITDLEELGVTAFPAKAPKKKSKEQGVSFLTKNIDTTVCVIEVAESDNEPEFLIAQGPKSGLLANLYDFPNVSLDADPTDMPRDTLPDVMVAHLLDHFKLTVDPQSARYCGSTIHIFTHIRRTMHVYHVNLSVKPALESLTAFEWMRLSALQADEGSKGFPATMKKALDLVSHQKTKRSGDKSEQGTKRSRKK